MQLAIALLEARGFSAEDFAFSHPGGALGRRGYCSKLKISCTGDAIPVVTQHTPLSHALLEVTAKNWELRLSWMTTAPYWDFTDGDLRRTLDQGLDIHTTPIDQVMTAPCKTISEDRPAAEALNLMQDNKILSLVVVDQNYRPVWGVEHMHDLLLAGVIWTWKRISGRVLKSQGH